MAVSRRLRFEILRRDDFRCRYCGFAAGEDGRELTVDHVMPIALGGKDEATNLVTACRACNAGKSSIAPDAPIVDGVSDDALRWARAMDEAAAIQLGRKEEMREYISAFDEAWSDWSLVDKDGGREPIPRPRDWEQSIGGFFAQGLPGAEAADAIRIAMNAPRVTHENIFKYFCGICWNIVHERQEIARGLIAKAEAEGF